MELKDKAVSQKQTTRTGRVIGLRNRAKISIAINDEDRAISGMWELVKKYNSRKKITAAETARRVFLRGLMCEFEEIARAAADTSVTSEQETPDLFQS